MEQLTLFDYAEFNNSQATKKTEPCSESKTTILLSLQVEYFEKMLKKTKQYEYRFAFPKTKVKAYIYAPRSVKAVIGYVEFDEPIVGTAKEISTLYEECGDGEYGVMYDYIGKHKKTYAMKVLKAVNFTNVLSYKEIKLTFPDFYAPQSYLILDKNPALLKYIEINTNE